MTQIEKRVVELQDEARAAQKSLVTENVETATDTYDDLVKRGETVVRVPQQAGHQADRLQRQDHQGQGEDHRDPGQEDAGQDSAKATGTAAKKTVQRRQGRQLTCSQTRPPQQTCGGLVTSRYGGRVVCAVQRGERARRAAQWLALALLTAVTAACATWL